MGAARTGSTMWPHARVEVAGDATRWPPRRPTGRTSGSLLCEVEHGCRIVLKPVSTAWLGRALLSRGAQLNCDGRGKAWGRAKTHRTRTCRTGGRQLGGHPAPFESTRGLPRLTSELNYLSDGQRAPPGRRQSHQGHRPPAGGWTRSSWMFQSATLQIRPPSGQPGDVSRQQHANCNASSRPGAQ